MAERRRIPKPELTAQQGLDKYTDATLLTSAFSPNLSKMRIDQGILLRDTGWVRKTGYVGNSISPMLAMFTYQTYGVGSKFRLMFDAARAYLLDSTADDAVDITGGNWWTGNWPNRFRAVTHLGKFYVCNGLDPVQVWTGQTGETFDYLRDTTDDEDIILYRAKSLASYYAYLIMGGTHEHGYHSPYRIRWCDTGQPREWDSGNASYLDLDDTPDWIVDIKNLRGVPIIYKEETIYELAYTANAWKLFVPSPINKSIGCAAPSTLVDLPATKQSPVPYHIFMSREGVHVFEGNQIENIADPYIMDWLFSPSGVLNFDEIQNSYGFYVPNRQEYWLGVPRDSRFPDLLLKYNFRTRSWTKRPLQVSCGVMYQDYAIRRWSAETGNWTDWWGGYEDRWMDGKASGYPHILMGTKSSQVFYDDGTSQTEGGALGNCHMQTRDFLYSDGERITQFDFECKGTSGDDLLLTYSLDKGKTWSYPEVFTLTTDFRIQSQHLNLTTKEIRWRFETYAQDFAMKRVQPFVIPRSRPMTSFVTDTVVEPEVSPMAPGGAVTGRYMLLADNTTPIKIHRIDLTDLTVDYTVGLSTVGDGAVGASFIMGGKHYFATNDFALYGTNSYLVEVDPSDMSIRYLDVGSLTVRQIFGDNRNLYILPDGGYDFLPIVVSGVNLVIGTPVTFAGGSGDGPFTLAQCKKDKIFFFTAAYSGAHWAQIKSYDIPTATWATAYTVSAADYCTVGRDFEAGVWNPNTGTMWMLNTYGTGKMLMQWHIDGVIASNFTDLWSLTTAPFTASQLPLADDYNQTMIWCCAADGKTLTWFNGWELDIVTISNKALSAALDQFKRKLWVVDDSTPAVITEIDLDSRAVIRTATLTGTTDIKRATYY